MASCVSRAARLPRNSRDCQDASRVQRDKKERSSNRASSSDSSALENHRREEENHLAARESPREINCAGLVVVCYRGINAAARERSNFLQTLNAPCRF